MFFLPQQLSVRCLTLAEVVILNYQKAFVFFKKTGAERGASTCLWICPRLQSMNLNETLNTVFQNVFVPLKILFPFITLRWLQTLSCLNRVSSLFAHQERLPQTDLEQKTYIRASHYLNGDVSSFGAVPSNRRLRYKEDREAVFPLPEASMPMADPQLTADSSFSHRLHTTDSPGSFLLSGQLGRWGIQLHQLSNYLVCCLSSI